MVSTHIRSQEEIALEDEMRPVWEVGVFAAAFSSPEYPAAGQSQTNVIPAPYFIYRGETLRIGEGSIARAVAIDKSWYELDVSLAGSFNANLMPRKIFEFLPLPVFLCIRVQRMKIVHFLKTKAHTPMA